MTVKELRDLLTQYPDDEMVFRLGCSELHAPALVRRWVTTIDRYENDTQWLLTSRVEERARTALVIE
jgi:hypothetical protein